MLWLTSPAAGARRTNGGLSFSADSPFSSSEGFRRLLLGLLPTSHPVCQYKTSLDKLRQFRACPVFSSPPPLQAAVL